MTDPIQDSLNETFEALRAILSSEGTLGDAISAIESAVAKDDLEAFKVAMQMVHTARATVTASQRRTLEAVMRLQTETVLMENNLQHLLSEEFYKGLAEGLRTAQRDEPEPQSWFEGE